LVLNRLNVAVALALLVAAAFTLAACGRNGAPLPPPGPVAAEPPPGGMALAPGVASAPGAPGTPGSAAQQTAVKNGFDVFGNPVAPPGQKKSFLLDPILQ
jgi:hypothetical protein